MDVPAALSANSDLTSALADARGRYVAARPRSAARHAAALAVMPGGSTRSVLAYGPFPTAMHRGEDCRLWDIDGHAYLDLCGEYTAGLFGHSDKRIHQAVAAAMANGINLAAVGEAEVELARIVCARFGSIERVRFTNSGTEGNLMALAAARAFTSRSTVMVMRGGYHGGVLTFSLAGPSTVNVPIPVVLTDYNDGEQAARVALEHAADLAAIIVEPMLGSGGCIPASRGFLQRLREIATQTGAVLIFDEVMTSRMSAGGLQARLGIEPDMTTLGKYVAGGMSFGAFGGRAAIMEQFASHLPHAGTFNNNVLSMAAGRVAMGEIFDAAAAEALWARGERLRGALNRLCQDAGAPMQFTGLGSMMTPHFRPDPIERPVHASAAEDDLRELFFFDMLEAGVYIARRGMVALSLPVGDADLDRFLSAVGEFLALRSSILQEARH